MNRLIAACGLFLLLGGSAAAQPAMIVLDASASMWGRVEERAKIAILREVLAGQMSRWPAQRPVGLMRGWLERRDDRSLGALIAPKSMEELGREPAGDAQVERELETLTLEEFLDML